MAVLLTVLYGLGEQLLFFLIAWVCSPFTALLALRLVRRWRPSMGKLRRALSAILLVSAFNVGFGLLISEPSYLPPLAVLLFGPVSAPFAVGLVVLLQRRR